ncbi:MAG: copper amine oxidase N-terminal domain-containing protein [Defluviitaleaceae bacterium]|nr:copper amine oxidase N-terminal domain-containing protein [Defluviitaleaceae bacterium]
MKRKIALLLAIVMVLAMVPANLFAAPGISVPLHDSTENRSEAHGSEMFTVSIPMTALRNADLGLWAPHIGTHGVLMHVALTGAGTDYLRFPGNSQWGAPWDQASPLRSAPASQDWALEVDASDTRGVFASRPTDTTFSGLRNMTADFYRMTDQSAWVALGMDFHPDDITLMNTLPALQDTVADAQWIVDFYDTLRPLIMPWVNAILAAETAMVAFLSHETAPGVLATNINQVPAALRTNLINALQALENFPPALTPAQVAALPALALTNPIWADTTAPGADPGPLPAAARATLLADLNTFFAEIDVVRGSMATDLDTGAFEDLFETPPAGPLIGFIAAWDGHRNTTITAVNAMLAFVGNANDVILATTPAGSATRPAGVGGTGTALTVPLGGGTFVQALEAARAALAGAGVLPPVLGENPIIATYPLIPNGASGFLDIEIPVHRVRSADARMEIRLHHPGGPVLVEGPLANFVAPGVTVIEGNVVTFEHTATLDNLVIRENVAGAMTRRLASHYTNGRDNIFAIRLTAPAGYTWERTVGPAAPAAGPAWDAGWWTGQRWGDGDRVRQAMRTFDPNNQGRFLYNDPAFPMSPFMTSPHNLLQWHCTVDGTYTTPDGRQELLILFDNLTRNPYWPAHIPAEIHLQNLRLVAGPNAPAAPDEVNIDVHVGIVCGWGYRGFVHTDPNPYPSGAFQIVTPTPAPPAGPGQTPGPIPPDERPDAPAAATPPPATVHNAPCFFFDNPFRFPTSLAQVTRDRSSTPLADNGLALGWNQNPTIAGSRTNVHVANRASAGLSLAVHGDPVNLRSGHIDTWQADNNNLFRTGRTQQLRINETVAHALALSPGHPITFTFEEGVQVVGVHYRVLGDGLPWTTRNNYQAFVNTTRFIDGNTVTISNQIARSNTARRMEIYFDLSVEAGFAAKNGTGDIYVTVSGAGAALLPEADNTIAVAQVFDPIEVTFPDPIVVQEFGREQNLLERTRFGDIVIEETDGGMLQQGQTLEIFIMRSYIQRDWDITLLHGNVVVDGDTGLAVSAAQTLNQVRNGVRVLGIQLTVTAQSRSNTDGGTIRLNANDIFGHVYPGENYWIVVSGNAVAANHALVHGSSQINAPGTPNHQRAIPGIFTSLPYYGRLIEYADAGVDPNARANSIAGRTFSPQTQVEGAPEMIWHRAPGMVHEGGFVGLRAFANIAGVDPATGINWVSTSRVANIEGWDWQGNWVTITMTQGSPWAQITRGSTRGASDLLVARVDIAEFSDGRTGPSGTVVPVFQNNRIYVPFRFVFNAFGYSADYDIERDGQVVRVVALP